MQNRAWAIESGWSWTGGSTTTKDTWTEIWGDGADAAVVWLKNLIIGRKFKKEKQVKYWISARPRFMVYVAFYKIISSLLDTRSRINLVTSS